MISDHDRSYYIGASDVGFVIGNWDTKTFAKWYQAKAGFCSMNFSNNAMMAGTAYEHQILDSLGIWNMVKDRQIIQGRLRVNLDGDTGDCIYEVKTYQFSDGFKVPKKYREQVCVQMYASGIRKAYIVAYGLEDKDYNNFYREIDPARLQMIPVEYDEQFVNERFLPRFRYLSDCLDRGGFPRKEEFLEWIAQAYSEALPATWRMARYS